jgi:prepilin-type N-terminal cleavage/methylation domain-containing protein
MKKWFQKNGFSLIELSVVITIISLTLGGALDLATKKTEADKRSETDERIEAIQEALEHFVIQNQRLPCPADGTIALNANGFGYETSASTSGCSDSDLFSSSNVYAGIVPIKTLGLDDDFALDGWNRRFTYVVDARFANSLATNSNCNGTTSTYCFQYTTAGSITIRSDVSPGGGVTASEGVYVIISHGKNGHGAFKRNGGTNNADRLDMDSTDGSEQENAEYDENGSNTTYDATFVDKQQTTSYDDIILYREKWHLISDTNQVTGDLCTDAKDVFDNHGSNATCGNANSVANCETLGDQVHKLCMQQ